MVTCTTASLLAALLGNDFARNMYDASGAPRLAAFLAYFGAIFLTDRLVEADRSAPLVATADRPDPADDSRRLDLSLPVLPFPQPWGFMLVAAISITVQLSAPWLSPAERTAAASRERPTAIA